jgi:hypothetical protein
MASSVTIPTQLGFGQTSRTDAWWMQPLAVFIGFSAFIIYSTWVAFEGTSTTHCYYWLGGSNPHADGANYLSPFFSPHLFSVAPGAPPAIFGTLPAIWPAFIPFSPGFLVMWIPAGFRFTCYYYRGAYYKAFWLDPVNCAVGEPRKTYWGERYLPLILQNVHRYFFYLAFLFIFILGWDAWDGFWFTDASGARHFGVAVGSLVLLVNVVLLSGYTLGCHSFRHLIGGFLDTFSKSSACTSCYNAASCLNRRHMLWAWLSLFWVGFTDAYIRLCAMGIWHDFHLFTL